MPDLGISVLLKGKNMIRLLGGLWVALRISLISVVISIPLGILLGIVMTWKNPVTKAVTRAVADRVVFIDQGEIVEEGKPDEFFTHPTTERAKKFLHTFEFEAVRD